MVQQVTVWINSPPSSSLERSICWGKVAGSASAAVATAESRERLLLLLLLSPGKVAAAARAAAAAGNGSLFSILLDSSTFAIVT